MTNGDHHRSGLAVSKARLTTIRDRSRRPLRPLRTGKRIIFASAGATMHLVLCLTMFAQPPKQVENAGNQHALDPFIAKAIESVAGDTPLRKLQKERVRERAQYFTRIESLIETGRWDEAYLSDLLKTRMVFADNLAELMDDPANKLKCYEMRVTALRGIETFIAERVEKGNSPPQNGNLAKATRLEAELESLKLKEMLKGRK